MGAAARLPVFFEALSDSERTALIESGRLRRWEPGEVIFRRADRSDSALVLRAGHVKVHTIAYGGVDVVLGVLGPGEFFGETAAVATGTRSATVSAIDGVEALVIPAGELRSFLTDQPRVALLLLELLLARLVIADMRRMEFVNSPSLARVAARLLELAERFGTVREDGASDVMVPIAQEDLASWSASSVEVHGPWASDPEAAGVDRDGPQAHRGARPRSAARARRPAIAPPHTRQGGLSTSFSTDPVVVRNPIS